MGAHCFLNGFVKTSQVTLDTAGVSGPMDPLTSCDRLQKPCMERVQALADISRSMLCCHSNDETRPLITITNPPTSAQLEGTATIPPSYVRVRAAVWECGEGQTDRHTDGRDQYRPTFRLGYISREMCGFRCVLWCFAVFGKYRLQHCLECIMRV